MVGNSKEKAQSRALVCLSEFSMGTESSLKFYVYKLPFHEFQVDYFYASVLLETRTENSIKRFFSKTMMYPGEVKTKSV